MADNGVSDRFLGDSVKLSSQPHTEALKAVIATKQDDTLIPLRDPISSRGKPRGAGLGELHLIPHERRIVFATSAETYL